MTIGAGIGVEHFPWGAAGSGPAAWTPAALGPIVWLNPDGIDAGASEGILGTWADASGNGLNFTANLADTTTYPSVATNSLDGHSSIFIDEVNDYLAREASPIAIAGAFDCWIVFKPKLSEQSYCLGDPSPTSRWLFNTGGDIRVELGATSLKTIAPSGSSPSGTFSVFNIHKDASSTMTVTVNGVDKTAATPQACTGTWSLKRLTYYTSIVSSPQNFVEFFVVAGAGDQALMQSYYQTKYPSCYP